MYITHKTSLPGCLFAFPFVRCIRCDGWTALYSYWGFEIIYPSFCGSSMIKDEWRRRTECRVPLSHPCVRGLVMVIVLQYIHTYDFSPIHPFSLLHIYDMQMVVQAKVSNYIYIYIYISCTTVTHYKWYTHVPCCVRVLATYFFVACSALDNLALPPPSPAQPCESYISRECDRLPAVTSDQCSTASLVSHDRSCGTSICRGAEGDP